MKPAQKIKEIIKRAAKNRHFSLVVVLLVVVIGIFFVAQPAHAFSVFGWAADWVTEGLIAFFSWLFLFLGELAIKFTIFALEFFIKLAQYNNYINAPTVMVGWVMVRDVANMFFVIALLMIAFGTMMGLENYMWTKTLVKLILAAVFVNFSNLICGLFIDFAHVFTITFTNAIASAAGGNVIQMFHLKDVQKMISGNKPGESDLTLEVLGGSIAGFIFAAIAAATMIAYLVVMIARVVVLWVLIVLSPLAFALQVIPQTEQYAKQWWEKFGKQVLVAPVMVFFLWLAFATVGAGTIATTMDVVPGEKSLAEYQQMTGEKQDTTALSSATITTWDNMANFLIPIALLVIGLGVVQQMGVVGGGIVGGALDFGKKVATIASGYAAGRWLAGQAWKGTKLAAYKAPLVGGEKWEKLARTVGQNILGTYRGAGAGITAKGLEAQQKAAQARAQIYNIENAEKNLGTNKDRLGEVNAEMASQSTTPVRMQELEEEKKGLEEQIKFGKQGMTPEKIGKIADLQKEATEAEAFAQSGKARGGYGYRALGWFARQSTKQEKHLKKSQGQAEVREKILFKRVGAEAGGWIFSRRKPKFGRGGQMDVQDRMERGILEAEEMRSKAKDVEFMNKGRAGTLAIGREKWEGIGWRGLWGGRSKLQEGEKPMTMAELVAGFEARGRGFEGIQKGLLAGARMKIDVNLQKKFDDLKNNPAQLMAVGLGPKGLNDPDYLRLQQTQTPAEQQENALMRALYFEEQAKAMEAQQKEAHSNALGALAGTGIGQEVYQQVAEAEVGAKVGEDFIKAIKSDEVRKKFEGAKKLLDDIKPRNADGTFKKVSEMTKPGEKEAFIEQLASLQEQNKFVAAIHTAEEAKVTEEESKAAREKADKSYTEVETLEYEIKKEAKEVHPEMMGEESGMTQTMRKAKAEYEKRLAEEALKGVLLVDKSRIINDRSEGSLGARLVTQLATNEVINEHVQGIEQGGMYKRAESLFHGDVEKIDAEMAKDPKLVAAIQQREAMSEEMQKLQTDFQEGDQRVVETKLRLGTALGKIFEDAFKSAESNSAALPRNVSETDEAYNGRRRDEAVRLFEVGISSSGLSDTEKREVLSKFKDSGSEETLRAKIGYEAHRSAIAQQYQVKVAEEIKGRQAVISKLGDEGEIPAWQAARAQAEKEHNSIFYRSARKHTMNKAAQAYIWDKHGVIIPNDGEQEAIEALSKNFSDMNYEMTVGAGDNHANNLAAKRQRRREKLDRVEKLTIEDEITFEEKVVGMAIFKRLHSDSWVDDMTVPIREKIKEDRKILERKYQVALADASKISQIDFDATLRKLRQRKNKPPIVGIKTGGIRGKRLEDIGNTFKQLFAGNAEDARREIGGVIAQLDGRGLTDERELLRDLKTRVRLQRTSIGATLLREATKLAEDDLGDDSKVAMSLLEILKSQDSQIRKEILQKIS